MMNNGVHVFNPKYAQEQKGVGRRDDIKIHVGNSSDEPLVGMGMAQVKREGGLYRGYAGKESMVKITEQDFLCDVSGGSLVSVVKAGRKQKHFWRNGSHYATKQNGQYFVIESVYADIQKKLGFQ